MKRTIEACILGSATILLLVFLSQLVLAEQEQAPVNKVAVVNGTVITQDDFDREFRRYQQQLMRMGRPVNNSNMAEFKKEVLEKLINFELLYQESGAKGIKADEEAVNKQLTSLKSRFPSESEFQNALLQMNLSEEKLRIQIRQERAVQQLVETQIALAITIAENEPKNYYDTHLESFKKAAEVRASHILIKVDAAAEESKKAEALKEIKEIQEKVVGGGDFAALAKEHSHCPSSAKGGDLGFFTRGRMVKPFEEAAFALETGKISDIVETQFGYHLIKVLEKKPESQTPFQEVKEKIAEFLKREKVDKEVNLHLEKLVAKASIERFLK